MNPPSLAGWNLALRFGLELAALAGLGLAAWHTTSGPLRWVAVIAVPVAAAVVWATFNVSDDPSRSGRAPVTVPGAVRLAIELLILIGGAAGPALAGYAAAALVVAVLIAAHYGTSLPRIRWLLGS